MSRDRAPHWGMILLCEDATPNCHCPHIPLPVTSPTLPSQSRLPQPTNFSIELQVLQEIISTSANATDGTSFLSIFKAYDLVLKARDIDPAKDRVYFKFLLKLARVQGATWTEKYTNILKVLIPHFWASLVDCNRGRMSIIDNSRILTTHHNDTTLLSESKLTFCPPHAH